MLQYINIINIFKNIIFLHIFHKFIAEIPDIKKYDYDIKFNMYRSIMCLIFTLLSFYSVIIHFKMGFAFPFEYHTNEFIELQEIFVAYIIYDLIIMIKTKCKRKELYFHHIFIFIIWFIYNINGYAGWLVSIIIFCEILSVVSGVDKIALVEGNMIESMRYKKIRKNLIKFIRLPIWIICFLFNTKYINHSPSYLIWFGYITVFTMLYLDRYWEKKCDKVICKYKSI